MEENLTTFTKNVFKVGGSLAVIIPDDVAKYEELNEGDTLKVMLIKLQKK